jgi:hypothetical protein
LPRSWPQFEWHYGLGLRRCDSNLAGGNVRIGKGIVAYAGNHPRDLATWPATGDLEAVLLDLSGYVQIGSWTPDCSQLVSKSTVKLDEWARNNPIVPQIIR